MSDMTEQQVAELARRADQESVEQLARDAETLRQREIAQAEVDRRAR